MSKISGISLVIMVSVVTYFCFAPVPIDPTSWQAPENPGYVGEYSVNDALATLEYLSIAGESGPEDIVVRDDGVIIASVHAGKVIALTPPDYNVSTLVETGGRPLGLALDAEQRLLIADAYKGLLLLGHDGGLQVLANKVMGKPIRYANNLDVSTNGDIYFTDSSIKFGAEAWGGSYPASLLDLMEHGGHGRLLKYHAETGEVSILHEGLHFANGVALAHDQRSVLISETGMYRVVRFWLTGEKEGQLEEVIKSLPSFGDNLNRGLDGKYWLGLVSPRNRMLDGLSDKPFLRKVIQRLPAFIRPKATFYSHVIAFDDQGRIIENLQEPTGVYPTTTGVYETPEYLYVGSLLATKLGRLKR